MLLDELTNNYLGPCKSKDGIKAEPIPITLFENNNFLLEVGLQLIR